MAWRRLDEIVAQMARDHSWTFSLMPTVLDDELDKALEQMLELIARGGIPSPERGADLLRRLRLAIARGRRRQPS